MSAHTPGPWHFAPGADNESDFANCAGSIKSNSDVHGGSYHIARIWDDGPNPKADARLIAAAPELLAALKLAEPYVRAVGVLIHLGDDLATVQAAIAKATGNAP